MWSAQKIKGVAVALASDDVRQFARLFAGIVRQDPMGELNRFFAGLRFVYRKGSDGRPALVDEPDHPARQHLERAISAVPEGCDFGARLSNVARLSSWVGTYGGDTRTNAVADAIVVAHLAGPGCVLDVGGVRLGLMLIGPGTEYPMHDHAAEELYYVASGTLQVRHGFGDISYTVPTGQTIRTPAGMPHALSVGKGPVLVAWLWMGDVNVPSFWWEQAGDGRWQRYAPVRPEVTRQMFALK